VRQRWSQDQPFREYDATVLQEKLEVVCENCNHTWMSDLTDRVKRAYSAQTINGAALTLMPDDAALLGAYAFMKSVVADHATLGIPVKLNRIPEGSRTALRSEREQQSERSDAGVMIVPDVFGFVN